ncbi:hypothetical protein ASH01_15710 [Terrabacter sp. Soil811]|uniref:glycosyltransferase n=1 Tax=Terrabacter sp. Soil811 TaxID=1736419 RepID=UPI0006FB969D|nr:glycosyltransferase [Terrabacter sp. Soil811]KRF43247.1 hypothetical protein ASH01_15710 [Terrabacter sp. Soil811]
MRPVLNGRAVFASTVPVTILKFHVNTVRMLRARGYEVALVSSDGADLAEAAEQSGSAAHPIPMSRSISPVRDLAALIRWLGLLARIRPGVVIAGTPKCALLALTAARATRVPRRVYMCGGLRLEGEQGWRKKLLVGMERVAMGAATEVVVNSRSLYDEVLAAELVRPEVLRQTLPGSSHGVDSEHFAPRPPDRTLGLSLGLDPDVPVVGFVGRLTRDKGIDTLIEAALLLEGEGRAFQLLVVGPQNEPDSAAYVQRIRHTTLSATVVGDADDVRPYFALMQVHVLPSLREGFPNVVLEAAAMEIPTVTTTATGCRDSVLDGTTGLLFPAEDGRALALALRELLGNAEARQALGRAARVWVTSEFLPDRIAEQIVNGATVPAPKEKL